MKHALIIEADCLVGQVVEESLAGLGFRSFDHVRSEADAVRAAECRRPDLVVVGDDVADGGGIRAARAICSRDDVPVLLVTASGSTARRSLPADARLEGPYPVADMARAIDRVNGHDAVAA